MDTDRDSREAEAGADGSGAGRLGGLNPLVQFGRLLPTALQDLRTIAEQMRILPDLLRELTAIRDRVTTLDAEVHEMRQGVDRLDAGLAGLRESVDAELHEVGLAVHPVRRVTSRLRRRDTEDPGDTAEG